ncbi:thiamine phosphate synthase [Labrys wisconsinensis]|uniref:Thiamine-phosphate pyrophosphorylase n=1 Tax=Labrys wisconsinensis TaxID=425677 RepID=A0ABU0JCK4_9HYPH|nr:thiamine phosphate synthase [Labrys wisconsinensis]MDQ0472014.1 thiamine-phosphate pyrophosphorylase [Labrys wisconsinensis]
MADADHRPPVQLYLVTPFVTDATAFGPLLKEVLEAGEVACVLLNLAAPDDGAAKRLVKAMAGVVQPRGAALIVNGFAAVVARAGADGIHVADGHKGLAEALESFKPERIVGAGGIRSRHDSMAIAETGVDYVMFGEPSGDGRTPPLEAVVERTGWWAELFEIPCVAYAPDLGSVPLLADAGADFVALGGAVWNHDRGPAEALSLASRVLAQREARA